MQSFPPTIILRHKRENLKKCSLRGLETRQDLNFYWYPKDNLPIFPATILLAVNAPSLTEEDADKGLFLIDGTWRYAAIMLRHVESRQNFVKRSLPGYFRTAYPRRQEDCPDPERGLASVEALFAAHYVLKRDVSGLLDHYHWKEEFLRKNQLEF